jgi:hypothetical protein
LWLQSFTAKSNQSAWFVQQLSLPSSAWPLPATALVIQATIATTLHGQSHAACLEARKLARHLVVATRQLAHLLLHRHRQALLRLDHVKAPAMRRTIATTSSGRFLAVKLQISLLAKHLVAAGLVTRQLQVLHLDLPHLVQRWLVATS